jgi:hypothetical protein
VAAETRQGSAPLEEGCGALGVVGKTANNTIWNENGLEVVFSDVDADPILTLLF